MPAIDRPSACAHNAHAIERRCAMLRLVTLAAVLGVIGGLAGAFAFSEVSGQADAVALLATRVREQNLDANGLIRVHEQGTANVAGTVDVGNLPLDADGNMKVSSAPPSSPPDFVHILALGCTSSPTDFC